jgi:uncharacterized YigZ family protein
MPEPFLYLTPVAAISSELKEQGSRFIAHLSPACEADEAMAVLQSLRKSYHDATHHCWAYRLGWAEGLLSRSSDDGEPSHTAGEPILRTLEDHGVSDAILVVVRYFGGVKLGTGGLARAYRSAARQTLEAAHHRVRILMVTWSVTLPYGAQGSLRHAAAESGVELSEQSFGEDLTLLARVPRSAAGPFLNRLERLSEQWKGAVRWKSK